MRIINNIQYPKHAQNNNQASTQTEHNQHKNPRAGIRQQTVPNWKVQVGREPAAEGSRDNKMCGTGWESGWGWESARGGCC